MNFLRNSRYFLNPSHFRSKFILFSVVSSSGYPLIHPNLGFIPPRSNLLCDFSCGSNLFFDFRGFRLCSTNVAVDNDEKPEKNGEKLSDFDIKSSVVNCVVDFVKNDAVDMESELYLVGSGLSKRSIIEVIEVLNVLKVPALRFFDWVRIACPKYSRNADICSLAVNNCGRLGDFSGFKSLLSDFRDKNICLSERAFGFLSFSDGSSEGDKKCVREMVGILNEVGGSCRSSGIHSLIGMLCGLDFVDLAKFVLENTDKRPSYYNVLVKHMCAKGNLEGAQDFLAETSRQGCVIGSTAYNYLISNLCMQGRIDEACSIPNVMIDRRCSPSELTYEMLIYFSCRCGRSDDALNLYNEMLSSDIKPRLLTHSAFIRGYISASRFDEAYRYVADAAEKHKWSALHMYNVLTSLYIEHGDLVFAHKLILEMFDKRLNPKFSVFRRASRRLHKTGRSELAKVLDARYSSSVRES